MDDLVGPVDPSAVDTSANSQSVDLTTLDGASPSADSGTNGTLSLSDLANSAIGGIVTSVGSGAATGLGKTVSQVLSPSPDIAAKAATPGAAKKISIAGASLPVLLVGGAGLAWFLLKR